MIKLNITGIDEAGRGSIIGPLVVAGVCANKETIKEFKKIGIKDSKKLTRKNRERFAKIIIRKADKYSIRKLSPKKIDHVVMLRKRIKKDKSSFRTENIVGLNELEAYAMASILKKLNSDIAFIDSCDVKPKRFKIKIKSFTEKKVKIYSLHKADEIYTIVSAASILAKYIRDKEIYKLQRRYGLIGSGYPSDNKTRLFLKTWILKNRNHPNFTRKSWKTWDKICNE